MNRITTAIKNAALVALCYGYALIRGRATHSNTKPAAILIMPASRLGDMICATPLFHAVKQAYPVCRVIVVGQSNCATIHEHNPDVDEYVSVTPEHFLESIKKFKKLHVDAAVVTSPSFQAVAAFFLAGIPCMIAPHIVNGYCPYQTTPYRILRPLFISPDVRMGSYAPGEYLKMLKSIGINSTDTRKHLFCSDEALTKIRILLKSKRIEPSRQCVVGISLSAGNKIKEWNESKFADLIDWLHREYQAVIIFSGSKNDLEKTNRVVGLLKTKPQYLNTVGTLNIDELKALISLENIFIGVDSGPVYVAEAMNVPTVDIVGPIDQNEQPPIGPRNLVVVAKRTKPELYVMNARVYNEAEARRQSEDITVDMVTAEVVKLIKVIQVNNTGSSGEQS